MMSAEGVQERCDSLLVEDSIDSSSFVTDDSNVGSLKPLPSESVGDIGIILSSPTRALIAKNTVSNANHAPAQANDANRFQEEAQKFAFLLRPASSGNPEPTSFSFPAPKPQVPKSTAARLLKRQQRPDPPDRAFGDKAAGVDQDLNMEVNHGEIPSIKALQRREIQTPPAQEIAPHLGLRHPGEPQFQGNHSPNTCCSSPSANHDDSQFSRMMKDSTAIQRLISGEQATEPLQNEGPAEDPAPITAVKPKTPDLIANCKPIARNPSDIGVTSGQEEITSDVSDFMQQSPVNVLQKLTKHARHRSGAQRPFPSDRFSKITHSRDRNYVIERLLQDDQVTANCDYHNPASMNLTNKASLVSPSIEDQPPLSRRDEDSFVLLGNRHVEQAFRVSKSKPKEKPRQARSSNGPRLLGTGHLLEPSLSEEDTILILTHQLHKRKKAAATATATQEQMSLEINALTNAYTDSYSKWEIAQKLCEDKDEVLGRYRRAHVYWKKNFADYQKFMEGFKKDFEAQLRESHKLQVDIENARQAEKALKADLMDVVEKTVEERHSSASKLTDAIKLVKRLEQSLKESKDSLEETSRLLVAERVKVAEFEGLLDERSKNNENHVHILENIQGELVNQLAEINNLVRECVQSVSIGRKETLPQLERCKDLVEALYEEKTKLPSNIEALRESILALADSIDLHLEKDSDNEANKLSEPYRHEAFEAHFSDLKSALEKNGATSEHVTTLEEMQKKLEAQLHASENALVVSQYEIVDRDAKSDLLKRKNLELANTLKVYEDLERECDRAMMQKEELERQNASLKESLDESANRADELEKAVSSKETEIQEKAQETETLNESLKEAEANAASLQATGQTDYARIYDDLERQWSNWADQTSAKSVEALMNQLSRETHVKEACEKENRELKVSLEKMNESDTSMQSSLKDLRTEKKTLQDKVKDQERSCAVKVQELKTLSENLQSKEAEAQLHAESARSSSTKLLETKNKLATAEKELAELRSSMKRLESSLNSLSAESQLLAKLRVEVEQKDEEIANSKARGENMEYLCDKLEQIFRRMGFLKSEEVFSKQGMDTVVERITILQLHYSQGSRATQREARRILEKALPGLRNEENVAISHKSERKANRSSSHAGKLLATSGKQQGHEHSEGTDTETHKDIGRHYHGVSSSKTLFSHRDLGQTDESTTTVESQHLTWTPRSHPSQNTLDIDTSPLSNLHSSEVVTPSFGSTAAAEYNSPHGHPQPPKTKTTQQLSRQTAVDATMKKPLAQISEQDGQEDSISNATKSTRTYGNGQRSILKVTNPPKRKPSSSDTLATQIVTKKVKLDAPPARRSDASSRKAGNTSSYFAATQSTVMDTILKQPNLRQRTTSSEKASAVTESSSKGSNARKSSRTGKQYDARFSKDSAYHP